MAGDASFNKRVLLLHFDGSNGSTTFTDSSQYAQTCTAIGNAQITTAQSVLGGAAAEFDGTGDGISVPYSADLSLAGVDWCVEGRARSRASSGDGTLVDFRGTGADNSSMAIYVNAANRNLLIHDGANSPVFTSNNILPAANTWYAWAVTRSGNVTRIFIDGVKRAEHTGMTVLATHSTGLRIGLGNGSNVNPWDGQLDELRITKGDPVYTADYTPSTNAFSDQGELALLMRFDGSNGATTFTDSSSNGHTCTAVGNAQITTAQSVFGGASGEFDGAGDSVDITYSSALNLVGGDWSIEGRARLEATTGARTMLDLRGPGTTQNAGWTIYADAALRSFGIFDGTNNTTPIFTSTNALPAAGTWFGWAITQKAGVTKLFVDGTVAASNSAFTTRATNAAGIRVGLQYDETNAWDGQFDEIRIIKGQSTRNANYTLDGSQFPSNNPDGYATALSPATLFGLPVAGRSQTTTGADPSTTFGTARSGLAYPAVGAVFTATFGTALGGYRYVVGSWTPTTAFGTPLLTLNTVAVATSVPLTSGVGTPAAFRGFVPAPVGQASPLAPTTLFGLAAASSGGARAASGFTSTIIPTPGLRLTQAAGAWTVSTAFGTPGPRLGGVASGFTGTVFGTPQIGATALTTGFIATAFGTPAARARSICVATGFSTTQIPAITTSAAPSLRTRGARFRQSFGVAQAERTAP